MPTNIWVMLCILQVILHYLTFTQSYRMIVLIFQERKQRLAARHSTLGCKHGNKPNQNKTEGMLDRKREMKGQTNESNLQRLQSRKGYVCLFSVKWYIIVISLGYLMTCKSLAFNRSFRSFILNIGYKFIFFFSYDGDLQALHMEMLTKFSYWIQCLIKNWIFFSMQCGMRFCF